MTPSASRAMVEATTLEIAIVRDPFARASECAAVVFFFSSRRRHTRFDCDWSSDVCSSDLGPPARTSLRASSPAKPLSFQRLHRLHRGRSGPDRRGDLAGPRRIAQRDEIGRSEEHTSELQSQSNLVCRLLLEKKQDIFYLVN